LHDYTVALCPRLLGDNSMGALADGRFDGYIWYSTNPIAEAVQAIRDCPYPIVLIHSPAESFDYKIPTVICDNAMGIRLGLEHLKSLGHCKIGFAGSHSYVYIEAQLRREAFLLHGRDLGLDVTLIDTDGGMDAFAERWRTDHSRTALIVHNEDGAARVMKAIQSIGFRVPDDVSIVGFDSTDFCLLQTPTLTSIRQPLGALGREAVERLVEILSGMPSQIETVLPCSLDVRESTGRAPSA